MRPAYITYNEQVEVNFPYSHTSNCNRGGRRGLGILGNNELNLF